MQTIEYRTQDKSTWGDGPWQTEPDKRQFVDAETGLPCLIVRAGLLGHLCGYVGVPEDHPWFCRDYVECVLPEATPRGVRPEDAEIPEWMAKRRAARRTCGEDYCSHTPESRIEVHGGLTFADKCVELTPENWARWRDQVIAGREEAKRYPRGDAARRLREWASGLESYEAWLELGRARCICHLPEPHESDHVWWFGFDCGHSGDVSPGMDRGGRYSYEDSYCTIEYVTAQCADLARQLVAVAAGDRR